MLQDTKVKEMVDAHLKDMEGKIGELNGQKERQKNVLTGRLDQKLKGLEEELVARHQVRSPDYYLVVKVKCSTLHLITCF